MEKTKRMKKYDVLRALVYESEDPEKIQKFTDLFDGRKMEYFNNHMMPIEDPAWI